MADNKAEKKFVNLNIDDLSPAIEMPLSIDVLFKLAVKYKGIKIGAFIIPDWRGVCDVRKYPAWLETVKSFQKRYGLRLYLHGFNHDFDNDVVSEFSDKSKLECLDIMKKSIDFWDKVDLEVDYKVFRPPRWAISNNLLDACAELGIKIVGVNWKTPPSKLWSRGMDVVYSNTYYSMSPMYPTNFKRNSHQLKTLYEFGPDIVIHAHFGSKAYDSVSRRRLFMVEENEKKWFASGLKFIHYDEATTFGEALKNADTSIQAAC